MPRFTHDHDPLLSPPEHVLAIRDFVEKVGGIDNARQILDTLDRIQRSDAPLRDAA